jgi:hypothetical protein
MADGITLDWSEFDKALVGYTAASNKDFAEISNKKLGDVALRASQLSSKASKDVIKNMYSKTWWPKFIQKVIHLQGGYNLHGRRKAVGAERNAVWIDTPTGKQIKGRKTVGFDRKATGTYKDALKVSKSIIRRRVQTVGMFKAVFAIAAMPFGKLVSKVERSGRNWLTVKLATPDNLMASFEIPFRNTHPPWPGGTRPSASADVLKKVQMGYRFLQKGIDFVVSDTDKYIERKMSDTARRYSAK